MYELGETRCVRKVFLFVSFSLFLRKDIPCVKQAKLDAIWSCLPAQGEELGKSNFTSAHLLY